MLQPESRAAYQRLLAQGWTDAIRVLHPKDPMYTFWDYMRNRWERDGGLRLDHILLSSALAERLQSAGVDRQTRGMADASDHAPVWVRLRDGPDRRGNLLREASGKTIAAGTTAAPKTERSTHRTGDGTGRKRRPARIGQSELSGRPLLVIDGDSFAHRSYHALPKTIRRSDGKAAGRHPWLRELLVAILRGRAAPRGYRRLGQLGGADETPRNVSRLSKRARVR